VGYDLVLTFWWGTTALHLLGYAAGWRGERVGYTRGMPGLLTSRIGAFDSHQDHKIQHDRLLRAADIEPPAPEASRVRFTPADADHVAALLQEYQLVGKPLIVLHPGADWACQQWQQERWMVLADELASRYQAAIVFTGVESEASYIATIQGEMSAPSVSLAGRTTLMQLAALLTKATAAVCVDSAIFELTQAANLPAVVLTGPTRPEQVMPGAHKPIILRRMDADRYATIRACRQTRYMDGGCHEYACPFAGLREISVAGALDAVERQMQGARQGVQGQPAPAVSSGSHAIA
jgi:ADP-heptose:LPS heptosyltransferase